MKIDQVTYALAAELQHKRKIHYWLNLFMIFVASIINHFTTSTFIRISSYYFIGDITIIMISTFFVGQKDIENHLSPKEGNP